MKSDDDVTLPGKIKLLYFSWSPSYFTGISTAVFHRWRRNFPERQGELVYVFESWRVVSPTDRGCLRTPSLGATDVEMPSRCGQRARLAAATLSGSAGRRQGGGGDGCSGAAWASVGWARHGPPGPAECVSAVRPAPPRRTLSHTSRRTFTGRSRVCREQCERTRRVEHLPRLEKRTRRARVAPGDSGRRQASSGHQCARRRIRVSDRGIYSGDRGYRRTA